MRRETGTLAAVRERLLGLGTMDWPLRAVTLAAFALLLAAGVLVALVQVVPLGPLDTYTTSGQTLHVEHIVVVVAAAGLLLGYALLVTGGIHGRGLFRVGAALFFTFAFTLGGAIGETATPAIVATKVGVIVLVWAWTIVVWYLSPPLAYARPAGDWRVRVLPWMTFCLLLVALCGYFAVALAQPGSSLPVVINGYLFSFLPVFLLVAALATTDYAEMGETVGALVAGAGSFRRGALGAVCALVACASAGVAVWRLAGQSSDPGYWAVIVAQIVLPLNICAGLLALALRAGQAGRWPRMTLPYGSLVLTVVAVTAVGSYVALRNVIDGLSPADGYTRYDLVLVAVTLPVGFAILRAGAQAPRPRLLTGMYLAAIGVVGLYLGLANLIGTFASGVFGVPADEIFAQAPGLDELQLALAALTLGCVLWLVAAGRLGKSARLVRLLLVTNVALQALSVLNALAPSATGFSKATAIALLVSVYWDVATSGEQITNRDSAAFPRQARVFVYLGYAVLVATLIFYLSTLTLTGQESGASLFQLTDFIGTVGLPFFGASLLVMGLGVELARLAHVSATGNTAALDQVYVAPAGPPPTPALIDRETAAGRAAFRIGPRFGALACGVHVPVAAGGAVLVTLNYNALAVRAAAAARVLSECQAQNQDLNSPPCPSYPLTAEQNAFGIVLLVALTLTVLIYAAAGYAGARATGRVGTGFGAGMFACLLGTFGYVAISSAAAAPDLNPLTFDPANQDRVAYGLVYAILFSVLVALGALGAVPIGAVIGRARARRAVTAQLLVPVVPNPQAAPPLPAPPAQRMADGRPL